MNDLVGQGNAMRVVQTLEALRKVADRSFGGIPAATTGDVTPANPATTTTTAPATSTPTSTTAAATTTPTTTSVAVAAPSQQVGSIHLFFTSDELIRIFFYCLDPDIKIKGRTVVLGGRVRRT